MTTLVWFRQDLRVADNAALMAALAIKEPILPVYIHAPEEEGVWAPGAATKWWLHHSLLALDEELQGLGSRLIIRSGDSLQELQTLLSECGGKAVFWNRRYEPGIRERDTKIKEALREQEITVESFNGSLLVEPWQGTKADGTAYQVYTPFQKNIVAKGYGTEPLPIPRKLPAPKSFPRSETVRALDLLPALSWADRFPEFWTPGSRGASENLTRFLEAAISAYGEGRNLPATVGTSRLSPHLHFGEISPNQVVAAVRHKFGQTKHSSSVETYVKEIIWREFAYHLLYHFPRTTTEPLRSDFLRFPWAKDRSLLSAWQKGHTGYPIVDAGMRELWVTGWMHNRVRMIVGSFLVKDLLIPWQEGARWFWDTLVDADLASNTLGWQWVAGCGADAAPYFRVFNPTLQGEKFDPKGEYVRRWVPEIAKLSDKWIHRPWEAPAEVLRGAGITLGSTYPEPVVDHGNARDAALEAYAVLKGR
ncbi:MAG: deoxyribodipyrimidine photo-lyase [Proteobacteria bacterium]|nr:deoxyribodipyrimidine photo-lyase [Pseudomonadota bacterium]